MLSRLGNARLGFLGAGRITGVIVERLLSAGSVTPEQITLADCDPLQGRQLADRFGVRLAPTNGEAVGQSDIVILATPPPAVLPVLRELVEDLRDVQLVLSLAALVPTEAIEAVVERELPVVRVIPNIPSRMGGGMNPYCLGRFVVEPELGLAEQVLDVLGDKMRVEEADMPIVTALTGMGPTYLLPVLQALADAAAECGLSSKVALDLIVRTFEGTASLVRTTGETPRELRKLVPATTVDESALTEIYGGTLARLVEGLREKEHAIRSSLALVSSA